VAKHAAVLEKGGSLTDWQSAIGGLDFVEKQE
jgi:hypothetical protein